MWFATHSHRFLPRPFGGFVLATLALVFSALVSPACAAVASAHSAQSLRAVHDGMTEMLKHNQFQRPFYLESSESQQGVKGDAYAVINYPLASLNVALGDPAHWCDVMLTHLNTKQCRVAQDSSGATLALSIVRKYSQPVAQALTLALRYRLLVATPDYLELELNSQDGPLGTRNYRILFQATSLAAGQSFLHFSYSYEASALTRLATRAYLASFGRNKVGFTLVQQQANGAAEFIGGMRGLVERNAMRYFLAIEAYLEALAAPPAEQFEKRLDYWFSATERYPRQLHELDRASYLELKRADYQAR